MKLSRHKHNMFFSVSNNNNSQQTCLVLAACCAALLACLLAAPACLLAALRRCPMPAACLPCPAGRPPVRRGLNRCLLAIAGRCLQAVAACFCLPSQPAAGPSVPAPLRVVACCLACLLLAQPPDCLLAAPALLGCAARLLSARLPAAACLSAPTRRHQIAKP
jgi:hypothetical protein